MFATNHTSNVFFLVFLGASILATTYHSILFAFFRDRLMFNYVMYLLSTCLFIFLRGEGMHVLFSGPVAEKIVGIFNEGLQIISFALYTHFGVYALGLSKTHSLLYKSWIVLGTIMLVYAFISIFMRYSGLQMPVVYWIMIRISSFSFSFILLYRYIIIRKSRFQKLILLGGIYFLIITLVAFFANLKKNGLIFDGLEWLFIGYMGDLIFFSIAIGYWIKNIFDQREFAVLLAAEEKVVIQRMGFEKTEAILDARDEERNRIAMDIHDDLGSGLTRIAILSEITKTLLPEPEKAESQLEIISAYSRELVDSLQDIIWVINSKNDSLAAMAAYLRESIVKFFEPLDIQVEFHFHEIIYDCPLSESQRRNLFLVIKELCNNIAKHAKSTAVHIRLSQTPHSFIFNIQDNGKGFVIEESRLFGNGLKNMRNRLLQIGGSFEFASTPGQGTQTTLKISF